MMEDEKGNHIKKKILKLKCFSPLRILTSPLLEEIRGAFLFLPLFSFSLFSIHFLSFFFFSMLCLLGVLMIFEEKINSSKISFQIKWYGHNCGYNDGGCIFWNEVMHANIAKP
jgi:hypothetical protein